ncbi:BnaA10g12630D [Brassica napus]|uniref:BnaA10g12630D protein n=1 Tax=Brassica napus TaxID=3708 RepID=A0A078II04_BRANA|nr:BnaA10g12630D [Brassica napus]
MYLNLLTYLTTLSFWLLLVLLATLAIIHIIQAQDQEEFTSLDCGLPADELSPYIETYTHLNFSSDATFIQSGKTARIQMDRLEKPYATIRYFPDGRRNSSFIYGNYDGLDSPPVFDLYLGPNLWATIDTGETTPLISALELRPMGKDSYTTKSGSLKSHRRYYLSKSGYDIRYSSDIYDRVWTPYFKTENWTQISTDLDVVNSNKYAIPKDVLKNAATPTSVSSPLTIEWIPDYPDDQYYFYAHFAEIPDLQANETREFNSGPFIPRRRIIDTISSKSPLICTGGKCSFQLIRTKRSTLPPLLNALEFYTLIQFTQSETDESDVGAIKNIAATYALNRISWQGDPCVPQQFRWDGLNCTNTNMSTPPRITTLNLSSSGLTGTIAAAIQNLTQLETMDLSNNNLTGGLPDFLGNMKSLSVIGNNLSGSIPQALQREGLKLLVEGNPKLCFSDSCIKPHKKKPVVPIVASVVSAAVVIAILVLFLIFKNKKSTVLQGQPRKSRMKLKFANKNSKRFTYSEIIQMTNNFQRVLGKGGFGMVYHGTVNDSDQVAVKVLSKSSAQGYKEFKAEVFYDHLALVYEFLPNADLKQHLSGKRGRSVINWSVRLHIALDTALGLEYLHIGCTPPMVHRDVKTANILLDENFKAKLADFGLSRSFQSRGESQESTVIAGTIGYLDPEYYRTGRLAEKSDVYSYGVVLLEMITNQPVISKECNIAEWVGSTLNQSDITEIMDPNLGGVYETNSAWRALELAMSCADPISSKRPTMSQVIIELKECIACENSRMNE